MPSDYSVEAPTPEGTCLKAEETGVSRSSAVSTMVPNQPPSSERQHQSAETGDVLARAHTGAMTWTSIAEHRGGQVPARCSPIRTCPPAATSGVRALTPEA